MTWWYRTTDMARWGAGTGVELTMTQGDETTWESQQRIQALEGQVATPRGIASISVAPGSTLMFVTLQDGTVLGPFDLPVPKLQPKGNWTASTPYTKLDLVLVPGLALYIVNVDHTSGLVFDPTLLSGGLPVYSELVRTSVLSSVTELTASIHTPSVAQAGAHFRSMHASGLTVTLPKFTTAAIPNRVYYEYEQATDGPILFVPEDGTVIVNKPASRALMSAEKFAIIAAVKVGANEWTAGGYLAQSEAE